MKLGSCLVQLPALLLALPLAASATEQQVQALQTPASAHVSDYAAPYPAQLPPPSAYPPPPMSGYGGHRFGVRPMPVAHAMGVPHRR